MKVSKPVKMSSFTVKSSHCPYIETLIVTYRRFTHQHWLTTANEWLRTEDEWILQWQYSLQNTCWKWGNIYAQEIRVALKIQARRGSCSLIRAAETSPCVSLSTNTQGWQGLYYQNVLSAGKKTDRSHPAALRRNLLARLPFQLFLCPPFNPQPPVTVIKINVPTRFLFGNLMQGGKVLCQLLPTEKWIFFQKM